MTAVPPPVPGGSPPPDPVPLAVDLDGTLFRGDLVREAAARRLVSSPAAILRALARLPADPGAAKSVLAEGLPLDPRHLPWREEAIAFCRAQRAAGRALVLATGSPEAHARAVADHLACFGELLAAGPGQRNVAAEKRALLEARFGPRGFDYLGNSRQDLAVWAGARRGWLIGPPNPALAQAAQALGNVAILPASELTAAERLAAGLRAMRWTHWPKNLLVFVAFATVPGRVAPGGWTDGLLLLLAFTAASAGVYLSNDVRDLPYDRAHARKRGRPIAAGRVDPLAAVAFALLLWSAALAAGFAAGPVPGAFVLAYIALAAAYSTGLKRVLALDVACLAAFYLLRIGAGVAASAIPMTPGLFTGLVAFFASLGFMKRRTEIQDAAHEPEGAVPGRAYDATHKPGTVAAGIAFALACLAGLGHHILQRGNTGDYAHPAWLWCILALAALWLARAWRGVLRGTVRKDPVEFALGDPVSWILGAAAVVSLAAAMG